MSKFTSVSPKTNTRELLLNAAIAVLETDGEAAIRVDELAQGANVSKPSVYHFFGSREGLVVAALAEMYRRDLTYDRKRLSEIAWSATSRQQFIDNFLAIIASFSSEDGARRRAFRIGVLGAAVSRPRLQEAIVEMHHEQVNFLVEFLSVGRERGFITRAVDLHTTALWGSMVILGRHLAEIDRSADSVAWDALTAEAFRHLLFGDESRD
jgi:AcrR family transcriptional regulator